MEISRQACRVCLCNTDFNISLFSSFCKNNNTVDKILVCLKLVVEETDYLTTICYKCVENVEKFYEYFTLVKKSQSKLDNLLKCNRENETSTVNRRHVTSYVREQVTDADYTFSFLNISKNDDVKEKQPSSPFFSYFSPQNVVLKRSNEPKWKTPQPRFEAKSVDQSKKCKIEQPRHHSRDLFDSQSQEIEEPDLKSLDWKFTPDNILKRVREKCFGRLNL